MEPSIIDSPTPVPAALLAPLKAHLPHSLALLRRAQFSHLPGGTSPHAHFLFASASAAAHHPEHFAAAYLDLSAQPETQLYLYSTLQDGSTARDDEDEDEDVVVEHVLGLCAVLFARVRRIAEGAAGGVFGDGVMVGGLHEATFRLLLARRGLVSCYWNAHEEWLFRVDELPVGGEGEVGVVKRLGLGWSVVRRDEVGLVASRTTIPKVAATLMAEPCVAVRDGEGVLVAWGFMGVAGTLSTLHVEVSWERVGVGGAPCADDGITGSVSWERHREGAGYEDLAGA